MSISTHASPFLRVRFGRYRFRLLPPVEAEPFIVPVGRHWVRGGQDTLVGRMVVCNDYLPNAPSCLICLLNREGRTPPRHGAANVFRVMPRFYVQALDLDSRLKNQVGVLELPNPSHRYIDEILGRTNGHDILSDYESGALISIVKERSGSVPIPRIDTQMGIDCCSISGYGHNLQTVINSRQLIRPLFKRMNVHEMDEVGRLLIAEQQGANERAAVRRERAQALEAAEQIQTDLTPHYMPAPIILSPEEAISRVLTIKKRIIKL